MILCIEKNSFPEKIVLSFSYRIVSILKTNVGHFSWNFFSREEVCPFLWNLLLLEKLAIFFRKCAFLSEWCEILFIECMWANGCPLSMKCNQPLCEECKKWPRACKIRLWTICETWIYDNTSVEMLSNNISAIYYSIAVLRAWRTVLFYPLECFERIPSYHFIPVACLSHK